MARRFFCDTNVLVYALGAHHPYRDPCREVVAAQGRGELRGEVTPVVVAELAHQRLRQTGDREEAGRRARQVAAAFPVRAVDEADAELALELYARRGSLDAFDALLAAAALNRRVEVVMSADRAFDSLDGLERVDPLDSERVRSLAREGPG